MNERKHNIIRFHWIRDMILSGIIFCLCDTLINDRPFTFRMFLEGVKFVFILECIVNTIINGLIDLSKESDGGNL